MSTLPPNLLILLTALTIAHCEGAREIGIEHVIAALDDTRATAPDPQTGPGFIPAPRTELELSEGVRSVMDSLGGIENLSIDDLRSALIRAKEDGQR